ncbi:MAG: hypothetical protein ACXWQE_03000 [Bdellovibrionales bacterium]
MRLSILMLVMAFSQLSWGYQFPAADGTYSGPGQLTRLSDGVQIDYTVTTVFNSAGGTLSTHYVYATGFEYSLNFAIVDGAHGTFSLTANGAPAGSGFCINKACQVDLDYTDVKLGAVKVSVSYNFTETQIVATGHNFSSGTIFQNTTTLVP